MSKMRKIDGYMTVEMSFILPMICFAIVILMSFFFYLMDYGIVKGIVTEEMLKASDVIKTEGKLKDGSYSLKKLNERNLFYLWKPDTRKLQEDTKKNVQTKIQQKVMLANVSKVSVKISRTKIKANVTVDVKVPVLGSVHFFGIHFFRMKIEEESGVYMEAESVRRWDIIDRKKD